MYQYLFYHSSSVRCLPIHGQFLIVQVKCSFYSLFWYQRVKCYLHILFLSSCVLIFQLVSRSSDINSKSTFLKCFRYWGRCWRGSNLYGWCCCHVTRLKGQWSWCWHRLHHTQGTRYVCCCLCFGRWRRTTYLTLRRHHLCGCLCRRPFASSCWRVVDDHFRYWFCFLLNLLE